MRFTVKWLNKFYVCNKESFGVLVLKYRSFWMIGAVFKEIDILKFLEILIMSSTRISAVVSINFKIFLQSLIWAQFSIKRIPRREIEWYGGGSKCPES